MLSQLMIENLCTLLYRDMNHDMVSQFRIKLMFNYILMVVVSMKKVKKEVKRMLMVILMVIVSMKNMMINHSKDMIKDMVSLGLSLKMILEINKMLRMVKRMVKLSMLPVKKGYLKVYFDINLDIVSKLINMFMVLKSLFGNFWLRIVLKPQMEIYRYIP